MSGIVVGIDGSPASAAALRWAAAEARTAGASMQLLHARRGTPSAPADAVSPAPSDAGAPPDPFDTFVTAADVPLDGLDATRSLASGGAADALLAASRGASMLVVGNRGTGGFRGLLLGSVAEHVARHAHCPVVVVPATSAPDPARRGRIVVGVDGSPGALRAVAWAADEAARRGAKLEIVSAYEPYDAPGPFGGAFMQLASPGSTARFRRSARHHVEAAAGSIASDGEVEQHVLEGHPARVLVEHADHDLLVVGRRGGEGFAELRLGSISRQVLHHARGPVAVVPT